MKKLMVCKRFPISNKYFTVPYKIGEKVLYIGPADELEGMSKEFMKSFIKVKRLRTKEVRTERRDNFKLLKK